MPLTWLYVPGDRPDRYGKALASGADVVIVDLEDAVAPSHKDAARTEVISWLASAPAGRVEVRVNALNTPWGTDDLRALTDQPALTAVRLPKVESTDDVVRAVDLLAAQRVPLQCLIETARGVEAAYEIARATRVGGISLGEADLTSDLGVSGPDGLLWARSRIVVAARAAGLDPPTMSAYPHVHDEDGLRAACATARRLGFVGGTAIHPRQLPVIAAAFRPSDAEIADARAVLVAVGEGGVAVLPDGRMVDAAMLGRARRTIALGS